jgi:cytoskeletal protein RodZ
MARVVVALRARHRHVAQSDDTAARTMIFRGQRRPRAFRDLGLSTVTRTAILLGLLTACSALGLLAIAEGASAEKAATSPATTVPHSTAVTPSTATTKHHSTATTTHSKPTTTPPHSTAATPNPTATAPRSTATAPQLRAKSGLVQSRARAVHGASASATGSKGWPTSAVVTVAALGAVLLGVAVTALLVSRRRRHNQSAPESLR